MTISVSGSRSVFPLILQKDGKVEEFQAREFEDYQWDELDAWLQGYALKIAWEAANKLPVTARKLAQQEAIRSVSSVSFHSREGREVSGTPQGIAQIAYQLCRDEKKEELTHEYFLEFFKNNIVNMNAVVQVHDILHGGQQQNNNNEGAGGEEENPTTPSL